MANIGGDIGAKGGAGQRAQQFQFPYFTSEGGGLTPQQTALSEYDYGGNLLESLAQFEGGDQGGGPSLSTMATQVAGGANLDKALDLSRMSDINQTAHYDAYKNLENIAQQNATNALAEQTGNLNALTTGANTLTSALTPGASGQAAAGTATGLNSPLPSTT